MSPPSTAAVTAQGVRDGERDALAALVERRGTAVLAYCEAVAEPGRALEAAGEAFARFRREVRAATEPRALDPEALLLRSTRRAAAAQAPSAPAPRGLLAGRLGATCPLVPELLAVRAEGELTASDRLRLARHLERCESCREAEARFAAGERAYQEAPDEPPAPEAAGGLLAALRAAAPNVDERRGSSPASADASVAGEADDESERAPTAAAAGNGASAVAPAPAGPYTLAWDPRELAAATAAEPAPGRRWPLLAARIGVPALVLGAAVVTALAVAGAFNGGNGNGSGNSIETEGVVPRPTVRVLEHPTTTPLPDRTPHASAQGSSLAESARSNLVLAAAEPSPAPTPAAAPQQAPAATPRTKPSRGAGLDARATGGTEAAPPSTGGQPAGDQPGFQPQP